MTKFKKIAESNIWLSTEYNTVWQDITGYIFQEN